MNKEIVRLEKQDDSQFPFMMPPLVHLGFSFCSYIDLAQEKHFLISVLYEDLKKRACLNIQYYTLCNIKIKVWNQMGEMHFQLI